MKLLKFTLISSLLASSASANSIDFGTLTISQPYDSASFSGTVYANQPGLLRQRGLHRFSL